MNSKKQPRVALLGCGYWGKNLARNFKELGSLATIADGNPDTSLALSFEVPLQTAAEIFADGTIDAVAIATPAETHYQLVREALEAGKHVFVEKPITLDEAEAETLCQLATDRDLVLMVGHLIQYHPLFQELRRQVEAGRIGELQYVYSNRMSLGKVRLAEDVLWSFSPHDISMVQSLTGCEPETVFATGSEIVTDGIADTTHVHLNFPNGINAHVQASWVHYQKEHRFVATGSHGTLVFEDSKAEWNDKLMYFPHTLNLDGREPAFVKGNAEQVLVDHSEPLKNECLHFIDCVANNRIARTDGHEGLSVLRTLKRASHSMKTGEKQSS